MNERWARLWQQAAGLWGRCNQLQKLSLGALVVTLIVALTLLGASRGDGPIAAGRHMVALIGAPIGDQQDILRIAARLDQEGAEYQIAADNRILVADQDSARRLRAILIREDLIPPQTDPFSVFDVDRFSITDFERNVNLQRALTRNLEQHITALDDVVAANVTLVVPETELFVEDQNPTTASIIITPRLGSDILENRMKVAGIQRLVQFAVAGLRAENIVILDHHGVLVNDFGDLSGHGRVALVERQLNTKFDLEQRYKQEILAALGKIFTLDRVQIVRLDIDLDLSAETTETEEHFPIVMRADNPHTADDESVNVPSITISEQRQQESLPVTAQEAALVATGAAAGAGAYERSSVSRNEVVNRRNTVTEKSPWAINRITVSVALDGAWRTIFQPDGQIVLNADGSVQRRYMPVSAEDLRKATLLIQDAIGWDQLRGDSVTVEHLQFDRMRQFQQEDAMLRREAELLRMLPRVAAGAAAMLFVALCSWLWGRRRRSRAAQRSGIRPARLSAAARGGWAGSPATMRSKAQMQQNAVRLARERPADAARSLRTWLVEK
jgi:flagellar M-ring protein FliF